MLSVSNGRARAYGSSSKVCKRGMGLREASWLYNVPVETLRRRVTGVVDLGCRLKEGAYPGTSFHCSDNGWITQEL